MEELMSLDILADHIIPLTPVSWLKVSKFSNWCAMRCMKEFTETLLPKAMNRNDHWNNIVIRGILRHIDNTGKSQALRRLFGVICQLPVLLAMASEPRMHHLIRTLEPTEITALQRELNHRKVGLHNKRVGLITKITGCCPIFHFPDEVIRSGKLFHQLRIPIENELKFKRGCATSPFFYTITDLLNPLQWDVLCVLSYCLCRKNKPCPHGSTIRPSVVAGSASVTWN